MSDYAPPSQPPPPHVPEGWKAVWNDQYKEYFYVNLHTKQSVWEKPTEPARAAGDAPPGGPPPSYDHSASKPAPAGKSQLGESDEALAKRLQAEENQNLRGSSPQPPGSRGQADGYYSSTGQGQTYGQASSSQGAAGASSQSFQGVNNKGLFSKLSGKLGGSSSRPPQSNYGPPSGQYGHQYPPQGYGQQYPPQGYQQYPPQGYGGYPAQQQQYAQPARKSGGMGALGGGAMGLGAGLLGGVLIGEALENHDGGQGYGDDGGYGGGDGGFGGGDDGGFGGDGGGGDF